MRVVVAASLFIAALSAGPMALAQDDCRTRAYAAMDRGLLSIRTEGQLMTAVIAPAFWPAERAAQEALVNDLDCAMNNPGIRGAFAVIDEMSGQPLAIKEVGQIRFID